MAAPAPAHLSPGATLRLYERGEVDAPGGSPPGEPVLQNVGKMPTVYKTYSPGGRHSQTATGLLVQHLVANAEEHCHGPSVLVTEGLRASEPGLEP